MPRIDYANIEDQVVSVLQADADLAGVLVSAEDEDVPTEPGDGRVVVFLERRDGTVYPAAASTRMTMRIRFSIWCHAWQLDSVATAMRARDVLVGKVEIALLKKPTLNNTVKLSFLEGGEFETAREGGGFLASGEVVLVADAEMTTA